MNDESPVEAYAFDERQVTTFDTTATFWVAVSEDGKHDRSPMTSDYLLIDVTFERAWSWAVERKSGAEVSVAIYLIVGRARHDAPADEWHALLLVDSAGRGPHKTSREHDPAG